VSGRWLVPVGVCNDSYGPKKTLVFFKGGLFPSSFFPSRELESDPSGSVQADHLKGVGSKPRWWLVTVGKRFTGTIKVRRFFKTEKQAKEFIADVIKAAKERGHLAFAIPQMLAVEAMELTKQLAPHNATLTDAVKFYLRHLGKKQGGNGGIDP